MVGIAQAAHRHYECLLQHDKHGNVLATPNAQEHGGTHDGSRDSVGEVLRRVHRARGGGPGGRCETKVHEALQFAKEARGACHVVRASSHEESRSYHRNFNYEAQILRPSQFSARASGPQRRKA